MALRKREELEAREAVDIARMAKESAGSAVFTVVVLAAIVILLTVSYGLQTDWDFSSAAANSLAPETVEVLRALDEPVSLYALYGRDQEMQRDAYWRLLRLFRRESDMLSIEFVDPQQQPGRLEELKVRDAPPGTTIVRRGTRRVTFRGMEEEDITNAVLEVGRSGRRVIGLLRGFGEHDPESSAGGGYLEARRALEQEYYEVVDVDPRLGIPPEVAVLVAAGPTLAIPEEVALALHEWLDRGGRLLALSEPGDPADLNEVLQRWGLRVTDDVVVDRRNNVNDSEQFLRVTDYSGHPVVQGFGERMPTAFPVVARVVDFETGENLLFHEPILESSGLSETVDDDGTREGGPFPLAAASWRQDRETDQETRVIAFGDSDWASNAYLPMQANRNLFLNSIAWLARETELIKVRRSELEGQVIDMNRAEAGRVQWMLLSVPLLGIVIGVVVAFRRRGR